MTRHRLSHYLKARPNMPAVRARRIVQRKTNFNELIFSFVSHINLICSLRAAFIIIQIYWTHTTDTNNARKISAAIDADGPSHTTSHEFVGYNLWILRNKCNSEWTVGVVVTSICLIICCPRCRDQFLRAIVVPLWPRSGRYFRKNLPLSLSSDPRSPPIRVKVRDSKQIEQRKCIFESLKPQHATEHIEHWTNGHGQGHEKPIRSERGASK